MKKEPAIIAPIAPDRAESLLEELIAECRRIIHDDVMPASRGAKDDYERRFYYESVVSLVGIASGAGDVIARLRGGAAEERRQRIVVERIETARKLPGGGGMTENGQNE